MQLLVSDHFWRISPCPDFLAPCKIGKINRMNYTINRIKSKWPSNYYLTLPCHSPKSCPVWRSPWIYSSKDFVKKKKTILMRKKMVDLFCQEWTFHIWLKRRSCSPPDTWHCICKICMLIVESELGCKYCRCWPVSIFGIRHWPCCRLQLCHKIDIIVISSSFK